MVTNSELVASNDEELIKKKGTKPTRPLSGYNLFFRVERARIVNGNDEERLSPHDIVHLLKFTNQKTEVKRKHKKTHGKIAFIDLARVIADRWNKLEEDLKDIFEKIAAQKKIEYKKQLKAWKTGKKFEASTTGTTAVLDSMIMNGQLKELFNRSSSSGKLPQTHHNSNNDFDFSLKNVLDDDSFRPSGGNTFEEEQLRYENLPHENMLQQRHSQQVGQQRNPSIQFSIPMEFNSSHNNNMFMNNYNSMLNRSMGGYGVTDIYNDVERVCNETNELCHDFDDVTPIKLSQTMRPAAVPSANLSSSNEYIAAYQRKLASMQNALKGTNNMYSMMNVKSLPPMAQTSLIGSMAISESSQHSARRNALLNQRQQLMHLQKQNGMNQAAMNANMYQSEYNNYWDDLDNNNRDMSSAPSHFNQNVIGNMDDNEMYSRSEPLNHNANMVDILEPLPISPHHNVWDQQQQTMMQQQSRYPYFN